MAQVTLIISSKIYKLTGSMLIIAIDKTKLRAFWGIIISISNNSELCILRSIKASSGEYRQYKKLYSHDDALIESFTYYRYQVHKVVCKRINFHRLNTSVQLILAFNYLTQSPPIIPLYALLTQSTPRGLIAVFSARVSTLIRINFHGISDDSICFGRRFYSL